jgi:DNA repair protein RecO (recombination protein O)
MKTERLYRTEAIVLRRSDFGEADRLLTLYTPAYGKLRVLAKGVRKTRSRKAGHLELYSRTDVLIARGRDLDILTQAELRDAHRSVHEDLARTTYAAYLAELLDRFTEESDENPALYELLAGALREIDQPALGAAPGSEADRARLQLLARYYELHLLGLAGYQPQLVRCVDGREVLQPVPQYFGIDEGGVLCPNCAPRHARTLPLSLGALKVLRFLQRSTWQQAQGLRLRPLVQGEVERLLAHYVTHLLERRLKSVEFLKLVQQQNQ